MSDQQKNNNPQVLTIPNVLSFFRIALAILFCFLFDSEKPISENWPAFVVLGLNALSDFLDGKLARALNQVSELGKILDPVADYLTKFALILCFIRKYPGLIGFMLLFIVRVAVVALAGLKTVQEVGENQGAIWAGKIDTAIFYVVMLALVLFPNIPVQLAYGMVCVSGAAMIIAIVVYLRHFNRLRQQAREKKSD